jgi:hypothetical protein
MRYPFTAMLLLIISVQVGTGMAEQKKDVIYINVESENLRAAPEGQKLGTLAHGTRLMVLETDGDWVKVSVEGWIWRASTTSDRVSSAKVTTARSGPDLELVSFQTKRLPVDYEASRFSPEAVLELSVRNNTSQRIKAWKALLTVKNAFGDVLFRVRLTDGTANIESGQSKKASFGWEDNQFIDGEPYDKLVAYSKENLRLELTEIQLIQ